MGLSLRGGVYHWKKRINGETYSRTTRTADRKEAETMAVLWEAEIIKNVMLHGRKPVNLHEALDAFLKEREGTKGYNNAKVHLRWFYELPNVRLDLLTEEQVQKVIANRRELGHSHNTLVVTANYFNAVMTMREKRKWSVGPRLERMESEQTRLRFLSYDEEARLLDAVDPSKHFRGINPRTVRARQDNRDLLIALLDLGCRFSEAAKMTCSQVDLVSRRVMMKRVKRGVDNTLVMTDRLYEVLKRRHGHLVDQYVFSSKKQYNNNCLWMRDALKRAGISEDEGRITLHTMRHTHASRLIKGGLSILKVQQMLGHRKLQSTLCYAHVETGAVAHKAAEILNRRESAAL
jgi:integrase